MSSIHHSSCAPRPLFSPSSPPSPVVLQIASRCYKTSVPPCLSPSSLRRSVAYAGASPLAFLASCRSSPPPATARFRTVKDLLRDGLWSNSGLPLDGEWTRKGLALLPSSCSVFFAPSPNPLHPRPLRRSRRIGRFPTSFFSAPPPPCRFIPGPWWSFVVQNDHKTGARAAPQQHLHTRRATANSAQTTGQEPSQPQPQRRQALLSHPQFRHIGIVLALLCCARPQRGKTAHKNLPQAARLVPTGLRVKSNRFRKGNL
jgi:hypothetical protein